MRKKYRILAILLSACMIFQSLSLNAMAAEMEGGNLPQVEAVELEEQTEEAIVQQEPTTDGEVEKNKTDEPDVAADMADDSETDSIDDNKDEITSEESSDQLIKDDLAEEDDIAVESIEEMNGAGIITYAVNEDLSRYFRIEDGVLALQSNIYKYQLPEIIKLDELKNLGEITQIPAGIFDGSSSVKEITIPSTVTTFAEGAFKGAHSLTKVSFEEKMVTATIFPKDLFSKCTSLTQIEIPMGIKVIGEGVFQGCTSLQVVKFGNDVETIERYAFRDCKALSNMNFKDTKIITIGENAFQNARLGDVVFPETLKTISADAFSGCIFDSVSDKSIDVDFSNTTGLYIGKSAFQGSTLRRIKFGNCTERISEYAFADCTKLGISPSNEVIVLELGSNDATGIHTIGANAFQGCTSLRSIKINSSVEKLEKEAFSGCSLLSSVEIYQKSLPEELSTIQIYYNAIPANKNMKIKGFDGTVKEWAGNYKNQGVLYESLYPAYTITLSMNIAAAGTITSPKTAKVGDTITVKATPNSGYILLSLNIGERAIGEDGKVTIRPSDIDAESGKIEINAIFQKIGDTVKNKYVLSFDERLLFLNNELEIPNTYMGTKLTIRNSSTKKIIANWAWNFTSDDSKTVSIDKNGYIRALKVTKDNATVKITAKLKDGTDSFSFNVKVVADTKFDRIIGFTFDTANQKDFKKTTENYGDGDIDVLTISNAAVNVAISNKKTANIGVAVNAMSDDNKAVEGSYTWTTGDSSVVVLAQSHSNDSQNELQVKGIGTTIITVVSDQKGNDNKPLTKQFVLRVIDKTPYIESDTLTINPDYIEDDAPVTFDLIPAVGTEVVDTPTVFKASGNNWVSQNNHFQIKLNEKNEGKYSAEIYLRETSSYNDVSSLTLNDLYLRVFVDNLGTVPYYVKLPTIVISKKVPQPTVKLNGKMNLFYTAKSPDCSKITLTVPELKGYALDQSYTPILENLEEGKYAFDEDKNIEFADYFSVEPIIEGYNNSLVIRQNKDYLGDAAVKQPVLTGYLVLKYVGYKETKVKITVPTENKKPSLILSATSATTSIYAKDLQYNLQLLDSKTKKPIDLNEGFKASTNNMNSTGVFDSSENKALIDAENNYISLAVAETEKITSKAFIRVESDQWNAPLTYTFTLKTTSAKPKAKLSSQTISINKQKLGESNANSITVSLDQANVNVVEIVGYQTTNTKATQVEADKIQLSYNAEEGRIVAAIKEEYCNTDSWPKNGTYSYKVSFKVKYSSNDGGVEEILDPFTIKVCVSDKIPEIKLKTSTLTLNTIFAGKMSGEQPAEIASTSYTWVNLSNEVDVAASLSLNDVKINNMEYEEDYSPIRLRFTTKQEGNKDVYYLNVSLNASNQIMRSTTSYTISGLKIDGIKVKDFVVKVKPIDKLPTAKLTAKGSINVLDSQSAIVYTMKISNYTGNIDFTNMEVAEETDADGNWNSDNVHFELKPVVVNEQQVFNQIKLIVNPDKAAEVEKRKYQLRLKLKVGANTVLGGNAGIVVSVTPTQTIPQYTLSRTALNYYMNTPGYSQTIMVECKSGNLQNIVWANSMKESILTKAFYEPQYDAESGKLSLTIKNPALLKKGNSYTLNFATQWNNQFSNVESKVFSIKITMK